MKVGLFDFQEIALDNLRTKLIAARSLASTDNPQAISFSAPTGAGKTIVMTALMESIFFGKPEFGAQPDAVILWISDSPELNEQTRMKIESKSDRIRLRQLVTIDAGFDANRLDGGNVYFMNTQKLGSEKLLTKRGDKRKHTIWETLTNTAQAIPDRFYLIIDEAHRGMTRGSNTEKARTILQKFLLGSDEDGLCRMPLVIGMSATPRRFEDLLTNTTHTTHRVHIPSEHVRESGLLKDRVLIYYPETAEHTEMSLLAESARRWEKMRKLWSEYCRAEGETQVRPILVIQVEDGTAKSPQTRTNLADALSTLENAIDRRLQEGEVAHNFNDSGDLLIEGRRIRRTEASRIEEEENIGVVLFKMSLSTGWDCPRAEVMMSFRSAQDHTYIAQLLGRMVRTPLARRIESDSALNDVHLFLPHYDQAAVDEVIQDLKNVEDVPPTETGTARELVTLHRREDMEAVFDALKETVTYRVDAVRKQSALRRLMGLGRALTQDRVDDAAQERVRIQIVNKIEAEVNRIRTAGEFEAKAKNLVGIDLRTIAVQYGTIVMEDETEYSIDLHSADINVYFQQAGLLLGNGLHMEYWRAQGDRAVDDVKTELIVLAQDQKGMQSLEQFAEYEFDQLYAEHKRDIAGLKEQRRKHYDRLRLATPEPKDIPWPLPTTIGFRRTATAVEYDKHLYVEEDGKFHADLGPWERELLEIELEDPATVGWLRNVDRQPWSLEVPYRVGASTKPMFPDLVIARKDSKGFRVDVLEPHDPSLKDNAAKAVGLAMFAEKHWNLFGRIQLIRKKKGADGKERFYRLDFEKETVRRRVLAVSDNDQLDRVFDEMATV